MKLRADELQESAAAAQRTMQGCCEMIWATTQAIAAAMSTMMEKVAKDMQPVRKAFLAAEYEADALCAAMNENSDIPEVNNYLRENPPSALALVFTMRRLKKSAEDGERKTIIERQHDTRWGPTRIAQQFVVRLWLEQKAASPDLSKKSFAHENEKFDVVAEVQRRFGVSVNRWQIAYRWLAPDQLKKFSPL